MEYHEAVEIAKNNPGSILTRDSTGTFIVKLRDGQIVGSLDNADLMQQLLREREGYSDNLNKIHANFALKEERLRNELSAVYQKCAMLESEISLAKANAKLFVDRITMLGYENECLKREISKVSHQEWKRIRDIEEQQRKSELIQRKTERRTEKCPCRGENENCARCDGTGEYIVDGFGKRI